jgi:hypothetical protein
MSMLLLLIIFPIISNIDANEHDIKGSCDNTAMNYRKPSAFERVHSAFDRIELEDVWDRCPLLEYENIRSIIYVDDMDYAVDMLLNAQFTLEKMIRCLEYYQRKVKKD